MRHATLILAGMALRLCRHGENNTTRSIQFEDFDKDLNIAALRVQTAVEALCR
jgi:hypothetical protein